MNFLLLSLYGSETAANKNSENITLISGPVWKRQRKSNKFKDRLHYLRLFGMKW